LEPKVKFFNDAFGKRRIAQKDARPICYASHKDAQIYSYYAHVLGEHYERALCAQGIDRLRVEADYIDAFGFQIQDLGNSILPFKHSGAYILKSQAKFHPFLYLFGLRQAAKARGVLFFEHTKALAFSGDSKVTVITKRGAVRADHLVMATYQPFKNPSRLFAKKGMYQSYVIEIAVPTSMISEGLYMDDHNPYHYLRVDAGVKEDRILLGGEDHRQEIPVDPEKNYLALLQYFEEYFPHIPYRIVRKWNGPILESIDGLPFIGRYDTQFPNRYVATAFSGNGMTYGTLSGEILSSLILGKSHPYHILYDPLRTHITPSGILIKTRDYLEELFNGGAKNIFLKKRRKPK
jgi:hypothetical protein